MNNSQKKKFFFILFIVGLVWWLGTWLLRFFLTLQYPPSELGIALKPFQNNYLALSGTYTTVSDFANEFSTTTSPILRFLASTVLLGIASIIGGLLLLLFFGKKSLRFSQFYFRWIIPSLLPLLFIIAYFIPPRLTTFDLTQKIVRIYDFSLTQLVSKVEIPSNIIKKFSFRSNSIRNDDSFTSHYIGITLHLQQGEILLGDMELSRENSVETLNKTNQQNVDQAVNLLNQYFFR